MNKLKVLFTPSWEQANPYQNLLKKGIESVEGIDSEVELKNYPAGFFPLNKIISKSPKTNVLHVHWISELVIRIVWSKTPIIFWVKLLLFWLDCQLVKLRGVKLVWTLHNKFAHESQNKQRELILRRTFCRCVDRIILHSEQALEKICELYALDIRSKTSVIFHGNYEGCYPEPSENRDQLREKYGVKPNQIALLYFGSIKPYKGVEELIDTFLASNTKDVHLFICGAPKDQAHQQQLTTACHNNDNIFTAFKFLDDQELVDFITLADAVVLPYSDTLTSGSVILAMTMGKALTLPQSATVFGVNPRSGTHYFDKLSDIFDNSNELLNIDNLSQMGLHNKMAAAKLRWPDVGLATVRAYTSKK